MRDAIASEPWGTEVRKIALHPTLPIGAVTFGVATVDDVDTVTAVEQLLASLPPQLEADPAAAAAMLAGSLHPRVEAMRLSAPADLADRVRLEIAMGFALPGGSTLRWLELGGTLLLGRLTTGVVKPTEALEGYFESGQYSSEVGRFGPDNESSSATVGRVRTMLLNGIAEEERRLDGVGLKCGFGADVAIIDDQGARLVEDDG